MMKKIISIILATLMVFTLIAPVSAAKETTDFDKDEIVEQVTGFAVFLADLRESIHNFVAVICNFFKVDCPFCDGKHRTESDEPTTEPTPEPEPEPPVIAVEEITVDKTEIYLAVGESDKIAVTVTPDDATDKSYTIASSDEAVATVDAEGNITAIAAGTATITATANADEAKQAVVAVTVIDMSAVSAVLGENDWATIQKVVKAGKAKEAGWEIGSIATVTLDGKTNYVLLIGLDQDGENTATFMFATSAGAVPMNSTLTHEGGYGASELHAWLEDTVFDQLGEDVKNVIIPVDKNYTYGLENPSEVGTVSSVRLFCLSSKETNTLSTFESENYPYIDAVNAESEVVYEYFTRSDNVFLKTNGAFWLRTAFCGYPNTFCLYYMGQSVCDYSTWANHVLPAFVVG